MRTTWRGLHGKILAMAKDTLFPLSAWDTRPHPDSRTMWDEFRHVTIGLEMSRASLLRQRFDYMARVQADQGKPRTRESVVGEMESALTLSLAALDSAAGPSLIFWLEHQGEHYGKLVSSYRIAGVVPPASRPRNP